MIELEEIAKRQLIQQANQGVSVARNSGLAVATGKYHVSGY